MSNTNDNIQEIHTLENLQEIPTLENIQELLSTRLKNSLLHVQMKLNDELNEFWNMVKNTKETNLYALYGVYVENCAKNLGFYDLLNQTIYDPIEFIKAKNIISKYMDINQVAKIISQTFHKISIVSNDLLLSGIIDVENIIVRHMQIRDALEKRNLWDAVNEQIRHIPLEKSLENFILDVRHNPFINIPEYEDKSLFSNTKDLVNSMLGLWKIPEYQMQSFSINESTWEHDALQPIVKFITYDLEDDLFVRWDSITSKASQRRNGSKGPIKKNDIFVVHKNNHYEYEVLLGEVSNGPFFNTTQVQSHTYDDHNKLGKCGKDSLDDALNCFMKLNNPAGKNLNLKIFKEINAFLIHAHGTSLELFILDQKFEPFFRLRRLSNISVPYKQGTIGGIIDLVQNLLTFRNILICTLNKLKEINNLFKMKPQFVAKESNKQNEANKSNFIRIPTLNTPLK
ncbi:8604_t:CDS:2 [Cetraspora pellucida]|uniref:8604_t:CDS:1 n=1 Tax=Cetraspora pellucida TaxID=1433469 RepID=A0ACA9JWI2_9GLOM|nr:8604_t:CDS:2 [Cetraspora pellucida]